MKKVVLLAFMALGVLFFVSCDNEEDTEYCWNFTVTTKCTGVPTSTVTVNQCYLTEKAAEDVRKSLETTASSSGITCSITATKSRSN
jgi:hypothetical protein